MLQKFVDGSNRDEYVRHAAAAKLAAVYRGRQGRKEAAYENRKQQAQLRAQYDDEQEINRPQAKQVLRPKGKSYIGFQFIIQYLDFTSYIMFLLLFK